MTNVFKFIVVSLVVLVPAQSNAMLSGVARRVAVQAGAASSAPKQLKHYWASQFGNDETEGDDADLLPSGKAPESDYDFQVEQYVKYMEKNNRFDAKNLKAPSFGYPERDHTVHSASLDLIKARLAGVQDSQAYNLKKAASLRLRGIACAVGILAVPTAVCLHLLTPPLLFHAGSELEILAGVVVAPMVLMNLSVDYCDEGRNLRAKAQSDAAYAAYLKAACKQKELQQDALLAIQPK